MIEQANGEAINRECPIQTIATVGADWPDWQESPKVSRSGWLGETEAQIAEAFVEARQRGAVLPFDEADSLLFDRTIARTSWEVGQVNELPTWLDRHPLPVVAATKHASRLDPAKLRRFVFKLSFAPRGRERSTRAFKRFFGLPTPTALGDVATSPPAISPLWLISSDGVPRWIRWRLQAGWRLRHPANPRRLAGSVSEKRAAPSVRNEIRISV